MIRLYFTLLLFALNTAVSAQDKETVSETAAVQNNTVDSKANVPVSNAYSTPTTQATSETLSASSFNIPPAVKDALKRLVRGNDANTAKITPFIVNDLFEVVIGSDVIYITADGKHFIVGDIRSTSTGENLTENKRNQIRADLLNKADEKDMIVFAPEKETQFTINVFTDVDCPYCAHFHQEVKKLTDAGVKVRYLAFPRAGAGSDTFNKMISVWCAKDRQTAITDAKAGKSIPEATCDNPVKAQYELGRAVGVSGTPALVLSDGELIPGYIPAEKLVTYLQTKKLPSLGSKVQK